MKRRLRAVSFLCCVLAGVASAEPTVLRAHVVPIVNQERFLGRILEAFVAARGVTLEVTPVHGREVARAAREGKADLVIMHTRFPGRQRLLDDGVIKGNVEVFANPIALLAPMNDPAGVIGAPSAADAMARIRKIGACMLENEFDGLVGVTRELAGELACHRRNRQAVGLGAVLLATRCQTWAEKTCQI
jgi:ABC-type tungstate transport system permease subunit